jgi:hypothetical protein
MPAPRKKATTKRRPAKPVRKPPRAHLLIIECESGKLARQGMHLGTGFSQIIKGWLPGKRVAIVQTSTEAKMADDLAKVFAEYGRFRSVLIVGHSDAELLNMTSDGPRPWATVGKWIKLFEPEFLFLAACEAGQSKAVRNVFESAGENLRQIYACPVPLHKIHTAPMGVLIYMLLTQGKINPEQSQALRAVHYGLSGGQLFRWRRNETGPGEELRGKLWDVIGKTLYFGEWDLLKRLFPNS